MLVQNQDLSQSLQLLCERVKFSNAPELESDFEDSSVPR